MSDTFAPLWSESMHTRILCQTGCIVTQLQTEVREVHLASGHVRKVVTVRDYFLMDCVLPPCKSVRSTQKSVKRTQVFSIVHPGQVSERQCEKSDEPCTKTS